MAVLAKTTLTSEAPLPKLIGRDCNDIIDFIEECLKYRFNHHLIRPLGDFVRRELNEEIVKGLREIGLTKEFQSIIDYALFTTEKRYVYRLELIREGSNLSAVRKVLKELLMTSSHLTNLAGRKVRRTANRYSYTIIIDCSDTRFPSPGIHRLARLLYALNDAEYLKQL